MMKRKDIDSEREHCTHTFSAAAASAFFASFSAFFARPDSFFAFPPLGGIFLSFHGLIGFGLLSM